MKPTSIFAVLVSLVVATQASPMYFDKRRFGVEHTPEADKTFQDVKDIAQGTDKEAQAGNLSGAMVRALLAKAPACDQQDRADEVIDLGRELGGEKEGQLIEVAKTYRQLERNTPNAGQPSELCDKPPKNKELDGLVQAQDPTGKGKEIPKGEDPDEPKANPKNNPKENPKGEDPEENPKENPKGKGKDNPKENPKGKGKDNPKENPKGKGKDNPKENPKGKGKDNPKENPKGKGKDNPKENPKGEDDPEENPKENPKGKGKDNPKENPKSGDNPKENPKGGDNIAETNPVGGIKMPKIEQEDGDFIVNGNGFNGNLEAAQQRQCDIQRNQCFNAFNAGDRSFSTQDCDDQADDCKAGPPVFA